MTLTVGSLFSGIGGFDLGLERAGMRVIWQSEIDPYASAVLRKHWPEVPNHGDIRTISAGTVERPDVLCGGFPCQPFSLAGKRRGQDDERDLWPEYIRVARELNPEWVVGENVGGAIEATLERCACDLEGEGYEVAPVVLPAIAVGAEHLRERLFIVAHHSGIGMERLRAEGVSVTRPLDLPLLPVRDSNGQWQVEPDVRRATDGVPARMDRLRCLGNAIVPQVAEVIGRAIVGYQ